MEDDVDRRFVQHALQPCAIGHVAGQVPKERHRGRMVEGEVQQREPLDRCAGESTLSRQSARQSAAHEAVGARDQDVHAV